MMGHVLLLVALQNAPPDSGGGSSLDIALATFGPGPGLDNWFGHTAIFVVDHATGAQRLFSYGLPAAGPGAWRGELTGNPVAEASSTDARAVFAAAGARGRSVRLQYLDLPADARLRLLRMLQRDLRPGRRYFVYRYLSDNCTTRPRALIDSVTAGALRVAGQAPWPATVRHTLRPQAELGFATQFFIELFTNNEIDHALDSWSAAAIPDGLSALVGQAVVGPSHRPLVRDVQFSAARPPAAEHMGAGTVFLLAGCALAAVALSLASSVRRGSRAARTLLGAESAVLGIALGFPAMALMILALFTDYSFAAHNENLIAVSPVLLLAVPFGIAFARGRPASAAQVTKTWVCAAVLAILGVALKAIPSFDQDNWRVLALATPAIAGMAAAMVIANRVR
ncbi:MAG TPA: DUF4105 domain-containing protein [Gemmatimonadaceae bacterium]|nr:DUF4105 domain-containing protein [Gemmatimonadaceae bacterium]